MGSKVGLLAVSLRSPLLGEKLRPSSRSKFGLGQEGEQNSQAGRSIHCQSSPLCRQGVGLVVTWSACYKNSILGAPGEEPPPPNRCVICRGGGLPASSRFAPFLSAGVADRGRGRVDPQLSSPKFHSTVGGRGCEGGEGRSRQPQTRLHQRRRIAGESRSASPQMP